MEKDLQTLVCRGRSQGYLTYDEVNAYLPDQDVTPEKLDNLLLALDESGIELVEQPKTPSAPPPRPQLKIFDGGDAPAKPVEIPKLTSDPIRMYLSQMAELP